MVSWLRSFTLQHPLSKPLFDRIGHETGALLLGLFVAAVADIFAGMIVLTAPNVRHEVMEIFKSDGAWRKILTLTLIGFLSAIFYLVAVSRSNAVYLAIILNFFPFWYAVVGALFFKAQVDRSAWILLGFACLGIFGPQLMAERTTDVRALAGQFVLVSCVPILYSFSTLYQRHAFGVRNTFAYILASALIDAPIFIVLTFIAMQWFPPPIGFTGLTALSTAAFVMGSLSSRLVGRYLFQKGVGIRAFPLFSESFKDS